MLAPSGWSNPPTLSLRAATSGALEVHEVSEVRGTGGFPGNLFTRGRLPPALRGTLCGLP